MLASDLVIEAYTAYRGKGLTKVPAWGTEKSATALRIANRKQREWAHDPNQTWTSNFRSGNNLLTQPGTVATTGTTALTGTGTFFTDYLVGDQITVSGETVRTIQAIASDTSLTVTVAFSNTASGKSYTRSHIIKAGQQEYTLARSFYAPSDSVIVTKTNGTDVTYNFEKPQARSLADVYIYGRNPKTLVFYNTIASSSQLIGGTLKVPGYYLPDDMTLATDLVAVDNPDWLVYATAAELARNDPAKDSEFANLVGMANDLYQKMISANMQLGFLQGGGVPYNMPSIGESLGDY